MYFTIKVFTWEVKKMTPFFKWHYSIRRNKGKAIKDIAKHRKMSSLGISKF